MKHGLLPPDVLQDHDWDNDDTIKMEHHAVIMKGNKGELIDLHTGAVIATAAPGYEWYFAHGHPHICPEGWKGE